MATTNFVDKTTTIEADWLNEVDEHVFDQTTGMHSSANLTHTASGTGATSSTVQTKLRDLVSVTDYGATGDGTTDDTTAIQAAIDAVEAAGSGRLYFPSGNYRITSTLDIEASGMVLVGEGADTGRVANANWPSRLFWDGTTSDNMIELDTDLSGDLRGVHFEKLTLDCQDTASVYPVYINTNVSDGCFRDCVIRKMNKAATFAQGATGWLFDNVKFYDAGDCSVDLTNNNHRITFHHCQAENVNMTSASCVVRIGSSAGHCSNINFESCDFEAADVDYQVDARNVRALSWVGGYMEAADANGIGMFKLGDTTDGTSCQGFSCTGLYVQGGSQINWVFKIESAEGVSISGCHFTSLSSSVIENPNGCPKSYYGANYADTQVFNSSNEASGFDNGGWVEVKIFDDNVATIPIDRDYAMVSIQIDEGTLDGGIFQLACTAGTAYINALASNGSIATTTGALTGTTGVDGNITISAHTDGNMYIENRYGGQIQVIYTLNTPMGADL